MANKMPGWLSKAMADGGQVSRISEDSKSKARDAEKRDRELTQPITGKGLLGGAMVGAGLTALGKGIQRRGPISTAIGAGLTYAGAKTTKEDFEDMAEGHRARKEVRDIRAGKPIEGEEDRKAGGRVKRKGKK